jgi:hypothetical protein
MSRRLAAKALVMRLMSASIAAAAVITAVRAAINPRTAGPLSRGEERAPVSFEGRRSLLAGLRACPAKAARAAKSDTLESISLIATAPEQHPHPITIAPANAARRVGIDLLNHCAPVGAAGERRQTRWNEASRLTD